MKHFKSLFIALFVAVAVFAALPARAQHKDFSPYKGTCWGMFYDKTAETLLNYLVPVEYVRPVWDLYVFPNFVGCGKDLILHITQPTPNMPDYYDITVEMEGGLYDDKGYFYAPFTHEPFRWTISAPYGELMGPIYQPGSYYNDIYEYIGLYYVRYPDNDFGYFDIKTQEDYNEGVEREYISEEEAAQYTGIKHVEKMPAVGETYYNLAGRRVSSSSKGLVIEKGRKVLK